MKRTISLFLTVVLVIFCATLLVACGGIDNAEDFDNAIEAYQTADAITLKIEDNNKHVNFIHDKERLKSNVEIAFDAEKGVVAITMSYSRHNFWEVETGKGEYEMYYVLDGTNVTYYQKYLGMYSQEWNTNKVYEFDTQEQAMAFLREKYVKSVDIDEEEFPTFTALNLNTSYTENLFRNKYTFKPTDSRFKYTYELNFSNGKVTKFTYQHKAANSGNVDDTRKFSMTIKYSADVALPSDLPTAQ